MTYERMRSAYLPAFAELFGIRPWEWDLLHADEAQALVSYVDKRNAQAANPKGG